MMFLKSYKLRTIYYINAIKSMDIHLWCGAMRARVCVCNAGDR